MQERRTMPASFFNRTIRLFCLFAGACFLMLCTSCHKGSKTTAGAPKEDSLTFLVLGDWGKSGAGRQRAVAAQMDTIGQKFHAQFVVTTGDNFYNAGVASVTDPIWAASYESIYTGKAVQAPWYPTLGNHDYGQNPQAQVAYSTSSQRWRMPARYYTETKAIDSSHAVLFVFTDTSPFVAEYYGLQMADLKKQDTAAQLKWLQQTLSGTGQTWKIVVGHHPVYSSGLHGNTPELISRFRPVFLQTKTDFYLCGHDHDLEYLEPPGEAVHYLVSGGGAEFYPVNNKPYSVFARSSTGFLVLTLYANRAHFYFYNDLGELLYQQQVVK